MITHDRLTERLILSRPDPEVDLEAGFAIFSDAALWTHQPESRHSTPARTRAWLVQAAVNWDRDGLSYWTARLRDSETMIGAGGVGRQPTGAWNIFYRLATAYQGQGLATELARAGLSRAAELDPKVPAFAWILPHNVASRRVAERLGLVDYGLRIDPSDGVERLAYADRPLGDAYGAPAPASAPAAAAPSSGSADGSDTGAPPV